MPAPTYNSVDDIYNAEPLPILEGYFDGENTNSLSITFNGVTWLINDLSDAGTWPTGFTYDGLARWAFDFSTTGMQPLPRQLVAFGEYDIEVIAYELVNQGGLELSDDQEYGGVFFDPNYAPDINLQQADVHSDAFLVNSGVDYNQSTPKVTALNNGTYIVSWYSEASNEFYGQKYNQDGTALGGETLLAANTPDISVHTAEPVYNIQTLNDGGFVVAWAEQAQLSFNVFDEQAVKQNVSTLTYDVRTLPTDPIADFEFDLAARTEGGFAALVTSQSNDIGNFFIEFDAAGSPLFTPEYYTGSEWEQTQSTSLTLLDNGAYIASWGNNLQGFVAGKDRNGDFPEFVYGQEKAITALADDSFVVFFTDGYDIQFQRYSTLVDSNFFALYADGDFEFPAMPDYDNPEPQFFSEPSVAALEDGGFVVAWSVSANDEKKDIYTREYNVDGTARSDAFLVAEGIKLQENIEIAVQENGSYMVTWQEADTSYSESDIFAKVFNNAAVDYIDGNGDQLIAENITVRDANFNGLPEAIITISDGYVNGEDVIAVVDQLGITSSFDAISGVLTLSGPASPNDYQIVLQNLSYTNLSYIPTESIRTISIQLDDGHSYNNVSDTTEIKINVIDHELQNPTIDALHTNDSTPTLTGTYDPYANSELTVTVAGNVFTLSGSSELTTVSEGQWSLDLTGYSLADNTYEVEAVSSAPLVGSITTDTTTLELSVDTVANIAVTAPNDLFVFSPNGDVPTLSGTTDIENGKPIFITFSDGVNSHTAQTVANNGQWSFALDKEFGSLPVEANREIQVITLPDGGWVVVSDGLAGGLNQYVYNADGTIRAQQLNMADLHYSGEEAPFKLMEAHNGDWILRYNSYDEGFVTKIFTADGAEKVFAGNMLDDVDDFNFIIQSIEGDNWLIYNQDSFTVYDQDGYASGFFNKTPEMEYSPLMPPVYVGGNMLIFGEQDTGGAYPELVYSLVPLDNMADVTVVNQVIGPAPSEYEYSVNVELLANGGWVLAYQNAYPNFQAYHQAFAADGSPISALQSLGESSYLSTSNETTDVIVATADGGWVLSYFDAPSGFVVTEAFDANGVSKTDAIPIYNSSSFEVTALSDGGWVIVFATEYQVFNADGTERIARTDFTDYSANDLATVEALDNGGWVIVWDEQNHTLKQKVFNADGSEPEFNGPNFFEFNDGQIDVFVNTEDAAGNPATDFSTLTLDLLATITIDQPIAGDNIIDALEEKNGTIISGSVVGVEDGQMVNITLGLQYRAEVQSGAWSINVENAPDDVVLDASIESLYGNVHDVMALSDGSYVVAWIKGPHGDENIVAQVFNADGTVRIPEFFITNSLPGGEEELSLSLTAMDGGGWALGWNEYHHSSPSGYNFFMQGFNGDGTTAFSPVAIADNDAENFSLTTLIDGRVVFVWSEESNDSTYFQVFNADGSVSLPQTFIDTGLGVNGISVSALNSGGWAIILGSQLQVYNANGTTLTPESGGSIYNGAGVTGLADGGWVISSSSDKTLYETVFNSDGSIRSSSEDSFPAWVDGSKYAQEVLALNDGGWATIWITNFSSTHHRIWMSISNADGSERVSQFNVFDGLNNVAQYSPRVTQLDSGDIVVTGLPKFDDYELWVKRFDADGNEVVGNTLVPNNHNDGAYSLTVEVDDIYGNTASAQTQVVLDTNTSVHLSSIQSITAVDLATGVEISGSVDGVLDGTTVSLDFGGLTTTAMVSAGSWSVNVDDGTSGVPDAFDVSALDDGPIQVEVTAVGIAGDVVTDNQLVGFDVHASISIDSPVAEDNIIDSSEFVDGFVLSGTTDGIEDGQTVTVTITDSNNNAITETAVALNDQWQLSSNILANDPGVYGSDSSASITSLSDGGWVIAWHGNNKGDGSDYEIMYQRFAADGTVNPAGNIKVDASDSNDDFLPKITSLADGGWIITWHGFSDASDGDDWELMYQRFAADGTPDSVGNIKVDAPDSNDDGDASLTALTDGGWLISWIALDSGDGADSIMYQRFAADGAADSAGNIKVDTLSGDNREPSVIALDDGGWVISWMASGVAGDGLDYEIMYQRFAANGTANPAGNIKVDAPDNTDDHSPAITALADGGWVIAWYDAGATGAGASNGVMYQRFAADSTADSAGNIRIDTADNDNYYFSPNITALADGGWVITWYGYEKIMYQRFAVDGNAYPEGNIKVNNPDTSDDKHPVVTALSDGGWVIAWEAFAYDSEITDSEIMYQRFSADGSTVGGSDLNGLIDGPLTVDVSVTDTAGNIATAQNTSVVLDTIATPTVNTVDTSNTRPWLSGTFDADNTETLTVTVDGTTYTLGEDSNLFQHANNDNIWVLKPQGFYHLGEHDVQVTVTNTAGGSDTDSTTGELTISRDMFAPRVNLPKQIYNKRPAVGGSFDEAATEELTVELDGTVYTLGVDAELSNHLNNKWVLNLSTLETPLSDGVYDVVVTTTDANNVTKQDASTGELTIAMLAPTVYELESTNFKPVLRGFYNADFGDGLVVTVNGDTYTLGVDSELTTHTSNDNLWVLRPSNALSFGDNDVEVVATDTKGKEKTDITTDEVHIYQSKSQAADGDVLITQAGDDTITINDNSFTQIDAGLGVDTLVLDGDAINLNFANIQGIDVVDLNDAASTANTLTLTLDDVLTKTDSSNLSILGDNADTVTLATADNWAANGSQVIGSVTYDGYDSGSASLLIEQGITVQVV